MPTSREICTQIYNDYREVEHFDHVKLMMLAYETGRLNAFKESKELAARPVMRDATVMGAAEDFMDAIREYERPTRSYASEVADPVADDRRAIARGAR